MVSPEILKRQSKTANILNQQNFQRKKPEIYGYSRKWYFQVHRKVPHHHAATRQVADRKKAENPHEKQNPGSIDLQCPGESKWRDSPSGRNRYGRDSTLWSSLPIG
jgi:hypothetical protein